MIAVAVVVCGFSLGMAGLLNYFKYRTSANRIVTERLTVTGRTIENVVHGALDLGLQFSDITTLPATLQRERDTDDLIQGIDVFDNEGRLLYSTDAARSGATVPAAWVAAAAAARGADWLVQEEGASAAGMSLKSSYGVTLAHLALRFSRDSLRSENAAVARELAINTLVVFVLTSVAASAAMLGVMRRLGRDVADAEAVLDAAAQGMAAARPARGPFRHVLPRFIGSAQDARRDIARLEAQLGAKAAS